MAVYKCKMCGGTLNVEENMRIVECDYCGTKQTVPTINDENLQALFNRANTLRLKNEFDKAEKIYEKARALADFQGDECLLDLYCGTGSIGLTMARSVRELVGVEVVPEAIECARENAKENGIENAFFFCADAGETENIIEKAEKLANRKISTY